MKSTDPSRTFNNWMSRVSTAAVRHCRSGGIYFGSEGAIRFARECGPAIEDFGQYGVKHIGDTYGAVCVRAYGLKPPIDAATWIAAVTKGYEARRR